MEQLEGRVSGLENGMKAVVEKLSEQTRALTGVCERMDSHFGNVIDINSGILPARMIRIEDHEQIVASLIREKRSYFIYFGIILTTILGISHYSDKETVKQAISTAADVVKESKIP